VPTILTTRPTTTTTTAMMSNLAIAPTAVEDPAPTPAPLPDLFKIDDLLPEPQRKSVDDFLRMRGWKFGHKSSAKRDTYSFWSKHFAGHRDEQTREYYDCAEELKKTSPMLFAFWTYLRRTLLKERTLVRCYANAQAYGSDGTIHTDSKKDESYTAVYYPHAEWHPSWGGDTVIFNADKSDIVAAVYPKPNRLLVFKGNIPHVARGVSRICPELRITLMFKTGVPDDQGQL
jgi:SM-20-related protein